MARKVIWTDPAVEDLEQAIEYIAKDSPAYAATLAQRIWDVGDSLAWFSERGHSLQEPELGAYRALHVGSYLLVYRAEARRVVIHAVLHGTRDVRSVLRRRLP
jgi:addiction module RelE/StbE family toxin